jgi:hypothetical protein
MSNKEIATITGAAVPAFVKQARAAGGGNIAEKAVGRTSVPTLSYGGKVFTASVGGVTKKLEGRNADGDIVPLQVFRGIILDYNARRGRRFYEKDFDPEAKAMPRCWSEDGVKPHASVVDAMAPTCAMCPKSAKNSKINPTTGKGTVACSEFRTIVVIPSTDLKFPAMRMQLAVTSDWDKQSPDLVNQGWRAFQNYIEYLKAQEVPSSAMLVTKMRFDPNANYPKLIFSDDRWLNEDEWDGVQERLDSDEVKNLLKGTWTPNGVDGEKIKAPEPPAAYKAPEPKKPSLDDDNVQEVPLKADAPAAEEPPKRKRRTKAEMDAARAAEAAPATQAEAPPFVDDDEGPTPSRSPAANAPSREPVDDGDDGLGDLAARWKNRGK